MRRLASACFFVGPHSTDFPSLYRPSRLPARCLGEALSVFHAAAAIVTVLVAVSYMHATLDNPFPFRTSLDLFSSSNRCFSRPFLLKDKRDFFFEFCAAPLPAVW